jgi:hypothetical protein
LPETAPPTDAAAAAASAKGHFRALTGHDDCSVTGVRPRPEGGWSVLLDVVELARIPSSTSVIATYRVDVDGVGGLSGYERLRRYLKGATDG